MKDKEELALKVTKEIVVKLIEVGRLSVSSFDDVWNQVHQTVLSSLEKTPPKDQ
jgi:hypothetical protein